MIFSLLLLAAFQDSLLSGTEDGSAPPRLLSSEPVIIPPDFCIMYADPEATCAATASFNVLADGTVSNININRSSRVWECDRAVIRSVRSRVYESSVGFEVQDEAVQSQTSRALRGR